MKRYLITLVSLVLTGCLLSYSLSFAKCPLDALSVSVFTGESLSKKKVYAEIKDKRGINKVELEKISEGIYYGELDFATQGFTFFIELSCSYFPKYLTIYLDDKIVEKIRLKKKKLRYYQRTDLPFRCIYEVNVFLQEKLKESLKEGSGEKKQ